MQVIDAFSAGEMLVLTEYNCEGIEEPWAFPLDVAEDLARRENVSSSLFRDRTRRARIRLKRGDIAVVIRPVHLSHPTIDSFYVVLVSSMKVCVYPRFLERVGV